MPSTVLGKRTRSSARTATPDVNPGTPTRATRRTAFVILDEAEQENPFTTPKKQGAQIKDGVDVEMGEDVEEEPCSKRGRKARATPAKTIASRLPLEAAKENSPAKIPARIAERAVCTPSTPRHRDALSNKVAVFARGSAPTVLFGRDAERNELRSFISQRSKSKKSGCIYVSGPPGTGKSAFVSDVCRTVAADGSVKTGYINCMSIKNAVDMYRTLLEEFVDITEIAEGDEMEELRKLFMQRKTSYVVTLDEVDHLLELDIDLLYSIFEWSLQKNSGLVLVGIANALDFTDRFLPRLKARGLKPHLLPFLPYTAQQVSSVITSKLKTLQPAGSEHLPFIHPTAIMFLSKKVAAQSGDLRKALDICRRAIDLIEADTRSKHAIQTAEITPSPTPSPSKTPLIENINLSPAASRSPSKSKPQDALATSLGQLTTETAPRATIAHMAKITAAVFSNGTTQRLQNLNLQQKAVLCSLSAMERKKRASAGESVLNTPSRSHNTAPTIKELFEAYTGLCKRENVLHPLTSTEFRDIVGSLETLSVISAVEGKAGSLVADAGTPSRRGRKTSGFPGVVVEDRRVASAVGTAELENALTGAGSGILKGILYDD
ncbi:P-loop containing nucleoside triphosphate hydrolase protein [Boeremia exigua]|uniref:P-loop containing nucleoside triphosphate hydrolase protein n=1 Tax=Boeremia exigua TaxID=749465 RepID=UPI001E8CE771|nr:P-loop containing nucleoside triphosphate hydrolase protein [Boeremia exigua]KAH6612745.1 P-loop containing nucleoside triphosphate hydrolase protein [Boeremia exigua]